jgi:Ca2+-binding RTX toxin-like protein
MYGGTGNDVYYVNRSDYIDFDKPGALNAVDVVIEAAGEGIDTVYSDGNFVLGANIENLTLTGTLAPWGLGNALNNIIIGNTSSNILNGGAGADRLIGGRGADTYYVDNVNDVIVEEALQGPDVVRSTVSYTLPDNVERLVLLGTAEIEGNGNSLHNVIVGNSAYNILRGGAGNDILDGGGSELNALGDAMVGGTGNDVFVIRNDGSPDVIADMGVGNDRIRLVTGTFGNIGPLTDGVNFFNEARLTGTIGTGPTLIYRDGILWFDSNGSTTGGLEPVLWFSLDPQPAGYTTTPPATLSVSQFELIA